MDSSHHNASRPGQRPAEEKDWLAEFQLHDEFVVRFRPIRPGDEPLILHAFRTASRETLFHRFFSPMPTISVDQLRPLLQADRPGEICIVGLVNEDSGIRIICGARLVRLKDPGAAELALTVHDDFQRRGLGVFLLKLILQLACREGIRTVEAWVLNSNDAMFGLLRKAVPGHTRKHLNGDVDHVVIEL